jgi:hypothetical protein
MMQALKLLALFAIRVSMTDSGGRHACCPGDPAVDKISNVAPNNLADGTATGAASIFKGERHEHSELEN